MKTKTAASRLTALRQNLKDYYLKKNGAGSANQVDRLTDRAVVRISKILLGKSAYTAIKETI